MFQEDAKQDAVDALYNDILNHQMQLNVEYKSNGMDYVTLLGEDGEASSDVGLSLVSEGYVLVENRKEKRLAKLVSDYMKAQDQAKKERVGLCIFVFQQLCWLLQCQNVWTIGRKVLGCEPVLGLKLPMQILFLSLFGFFSYTSLS